MIRNEHNPHPQPLPPTGTSVGRIAMGRGEGEGTNFAPSYLSAFALIIFLVLSQIWIISAQDSPPILYAGVYPAQDLAAYIENARPMDMTGAQSGEAVWSEGFSAQVYGTDVVIRFHLGPQLAARGNANLPPPDADGWYETVTPLSLSAASHTLNLGTPEYPLILDTITIYDRTWENLFPLAGGVAIAVGMLLLVLLSALRERRK